MIIWDYFVICVLLLRSNIFCLFFAVAVGEFSPLFKTIPGEMRNTELFLANFCYKQEYLQTLVVSLTK